MKGRETEMYSQTSNLTDSPYKYLKQPGLGWNGVWNPVEFSHVSSREPGTLVITWGFPGCAHTRTHTLTHIHNKLESGDKAGTQTRAL